MLIGGVKDVLLEQGQTGGDGGSQGGRRCTFRHRKGSTENKFHRSRLVVTRRSELGRPGRS